MAKSMRVGDPLQSDAWTRVLGLEGCRVRAKRVDTGELRPAAIPTLRINDHVFAAKSSLAGTGGARRSSSRPGCAISDAGPLRRVDFRDSI